MVYHKEEFEFGWDAQDVVRVAEHVRDFALHLAEAMEEELTEKNFGPRVRTGLVREARFSYEAARTVENELTRLVSTISDHSLNLASAAKLLGEKTKSFYIEPIEEARHTPETHDGLKVN